MLMSNIFTNGMVDVMEKKINQDELAIFDINRDMRKAEKKLYGHRGKNIMNTDIKEHDEGYELYMDLPGFTKDEVKVSLENGYLTVEAAKGLDEDKEDKKNSKYICRERYAGDCRRSFYVGDAVTQEDIKASFKHGILKLEVPKKEKKSEIEKKNYVAIEG
jgi:HSP20 family protein